MRRGPARAVRRSEGQRPAHCARHHDHQPRCPEPGATYPRPSCEPRLRRGPGSCPFMPRDGAGEVGPEGRDGAPRWSANTIVPRRAVAALADSLGAPGPRPRRRCRLDTMAPRRRRSSRRPGTVAAVMGRSFPLEATIGGRRWAGDGSTLGPGAPRRRALTRLSTAAHRRRDAACRACAGGAAPTGVRLRRAARSPGPRPPRRGRAHRAPRPSSSPPFNPM